MASYPPRTQLNPLIIVVARWSPIICCFLREIYHLFPRPWRGSCTFSRGVIDDPQRTVTEQAGVNYRGGKIIPCQLAVVVLRRMSSFCEPTERFNRLLLVISIDDLKQCFPTFISLCTLRFYSLITLLLYYSHNIHSNPVKNIFCILFRRKTRSTFEIKNILRIQIIFPCILRCLATNCRRNDPFFLRFT